MTITLELPPATKTKLRDAALASGMDLPAYLLKVIDAYLAVGTASLRTMLGPIHNEIRKRGVSEATLTTLLADELAALRADRPAP